MKSRSYIYFCKEHVFRLMFLYNDNGLTGEVEAVVVAMGMS